MGIVCDFLTIPKISGLMPNRSQSYFNILSLGLTQEVMNRTQNLIQTERTNIWNNSLRLESIQFMCDGYYV